MIRLLRADVCVPLSGVVRRLKRTDVHPSNEVPQTRYEMRLRRKRHRYLLAAALAAVVAPAAYAFTAANTVPSSNAGSGSGTISGYTVSNVSYTLNASNPQNVDQVAFTITPTTGTVKAQLVS